MKKTAAAAAAAVAGPSLIQACGSVPEAGTANLIVPAGAGLPITGTFMDEISHDIPHQNW